MIKHFAFLIVAFVVSAAAVNAQQVFVADTATLNIGAGEAQSTVVAPGKKPQCQQGRFLVTNDGARPPQGVVFGRNLDNPNGPVIGSTFDTGKLAGFNANDPTKSKYSFGTNDHDLLTLSNGDVLYLTGAFSRVSLGNPLSAIGMQNDGEQIAVKKNPAWFDDTFRDGVCAKFAADGSCAETFPFGPGARSVLLVWRSTDCGETFQYVSQMDPARVGDGSCALPQFRRYANGNIINAKPYDMGGSDGQLVKVDPANDHLFLTFQCVGFQQDNSLPPGFKPPPLNTVDPNAPQPILPFKLSKNPLNKTLVLASYNEGSSWQTLGTIDQAAWRFGVVPEGDELGFGFANSFLFGRKNGSGKYDFDATGVAAPNGYWSWWNKSNLVADSNIPVGNIYANMWAHPILARTPGTKSYLLAFPDSPSTSSGFGYRVYFYNDGSKKLVEGNAVLPAKQNADNVAFHLTAVDPGKGPIMLYWYDLDSAAKTITIRGRFITGEGEYSNDFTISQSAGTAASFNLAAPNYWFGDYQTAGGFVSEVAQTQGQGTFKLTAQKSTHYNFYPMWIEPDGTVRYARVVYSTKGSVLENLANAGNANGAQMARPINLTAIPLPQWKPQPNPIPLYQIQRPVLERETSREPDTRPRVRAPLRVIPKVRP